MTHSFRPFHYACLVLCSLLLSWSAHASDVVAQHYAAANAPSVQSVCTAGYDLLSGNVATSKPLIQGALPYVLSYNAPLRQNVSAALNFITPEHTNAGWSDNYQSYVQARRIQTNTTLYNSLSISRIPDSFGYKSGLYNLVTSNPSYSNSIVNLITILLPGEKVATVFKEQDGVFSRLYSADPMGIVDSAVIQELPWNTNLGEYQIHRVSGSLVVSKHGTKYSISDTSYSAAPPTSHRDAVYVYRDSEDVLQTTRDLFGSNRSSNTEVLSRSETTVVTVYQRISQVSSQGKSLNFLYDSKLNLTQVSDHLNNQLVFERTHNAAAQTDAESRLVTKVTYTSGTGIASQVANMTYQAFDSRMPRTGTLFQLYSLSTASSTASSESNYEYSSYLNGAVPYLVNSRRDGSAWDRYSSISYMYPVLRSVLNESSQPQQRWEIQQDYQLIPHNLNYTTARTTLRSYGVSGNTTGNVADSTTIYDDIARSIQLTRSPNGVSQATTTVTTTINSNTDITLNITGAPCLVSGSTPIASMRVLTSRSQLQQVTDAKGVTSNIGYDSANRVTSVQQAVGRPEARTTTYTYGALSNGAANPYNIPTTITKPYQTITNVINANGQITQQTQASSQAGSTPKVIDYTYYINGLLNTVNGPLAGDVDKVTYAYDSYGNKASESQVVNGATRTTQYLSYNSFGSPERIVYPNGLVDQFIYNADGALQRKNHGVGGTTGTISGQTVSYTYDTLKRVKTETSPDGEVTTYDYDALGRVIKTSHPDGSATHKTYYPNGAVSAEETKNAAGVLFVASSQELDSNGRVAKVRSGSNTDWYWESYGYDANGNKIQATSRLGTVGTWTYDAFNKVTSHTDGEGNTSTKAYDLQDNVTAAKDAVNSGSTPIEYINGGILKKESNPDLGIKTYSHDAADRVTQVLHHVRQCGYGNLDVLGRPASHICVQNNGAAISGTYVHNYAYTYDATRFGRLESANSVGNSYGTDTSYSYDAYDRVIGKTQTVKAITAWNGTQPTRSVSYGYSTGGKLTSMTLPSGRIVNYNYDFAKGQMTGVAVNGSNLINSIAYNGAGQTLSWTWGNGSTYGIVYDTFKNGNIKTITNSTAANVQNYKADYSFNSAGQIVAITGLSTRDNYTYDKVNRLLTENRTNLSTNAAIFGITYTYDKNGNRLTLRGTGTDQQPAATVDYTYHANRNRLATITRNGVVTSPAHLTEGELRLDSVSGYDSHGQRRWSGKRNGDTTQPEYYFAYNHKRERTVRASRNDGLNSYAASAVQYVYDEASHLIGEYTASGAPIVEYVWKGDVPIAAIYGPTSATKIYYIITDAQNTPRRLIDSSNNVVDWAWDSTAFGVAQPSVEKVNFNLRFPGQYYDAITKQHYNLNRYYNPEIGRYMEADPIGLAGGLNPYAYAGSNPVMNVDPSGLVLESMNDDFLSGASISNSLNFAGMNTWRELEPDFSSMQLNRGFYDKITLHHTGSRATARSVEQLHRSNGGGVESIVRDTLGGRVPGVQSYNYSDVGYHFLVASTGDVIYARSLLYQGAHVSGNNPNNIGVAFLGDFSKNSLSSAQYSAGSQLVYNLAMYFSIPSENIKTHGQYDYNKHSELQGASAQIAAIKNRVSAPAPCLPLMCPW